MPEPSLDPVILIIDDDPTIRFLVRENLESLGFVVEEAADGLSGIEIFQEISPDLVLLDILMPEMDGFEVCERLRHLEEGAPVPILMLTALEDMDSIDRAYSTGVTDFTTKPINWSLLGRRIRYLIRANLAMEQALINGERLKEAQRLAHIGSWEWDIRNNLLIWSDEVYRIFGADPKAFNADYEAFLQFVHPDDRHRVTNSVDTALEQLSNYTIDHRIIRTDSEMRYVQEHARVIYDQDRRPLRMLGTVQDITDRKQAEERIHNLAYYDELTGLPNRVFFDEQLRRVLGLAGRHREFVVVIVLDLDHFRRINDTLGNKFGDLLLCAVADNIRDCLRDSDYADCLAGMGVDSLARLGGDEFALMLPEVTENHGTAVVAGRLKKCLEPPFVLDGREIIVTCSMGIAIYPHDGEDAHTLMKNAGTAMFHAKQSRRGGFRFYSDDMHKGVLERLNLETLLHSAMGQGEFLLYYQPKFKLAESALVGAEALIRWRHPVRGVLEPVEFLPVAEQLGLLPAIGDWVMNESARQLRAWDYLTERKLVMAVNVSSYQFRDQDLVDRVKSLLNRHGIDGRRLELELTETTLVTDLDATRTVLCDLRQQGVRVAIDDFGTGYSSLSYLKKFPVDTLKIDRSFLESIENTDENSAIVEAIVNLAHTLGLEVVAEGVESLVQKSFLAGIGCDLVQGRLLGPPVPAEEFEAWIV